MGSPETLVRLGRVLLCRVLFSWIVRVENAEKGPNRRPKKHTTARLEARVRLPMVDWAVGLYRLGDGNQLESFCPGLGVQTRQFPFRAPLFEFRGAAVHPGFTACKQTVDQHREVSGHGIDRSR